MCFYSRYDYFKGANVDLVKPIGVFRLLLLFKMALNGASGCDIIQPKACENTHQEKILSSGIQLRTSARVLKKQKLDLEASLAVKEAKKGSWYYRKL